MKEEAAELKTVLEDKYDLNISFKFIDVNTEEINEYPDISSLLGRVHLPLTAINGKPAFHGGLSADLISQAIDKAKQDNI
ncbi:MAG: hypothetical protein K9L17_01955 [Clostridiales bacterium]|nr:hypothetical protein [Clostridiales bacterium]MCF8021447.1 hypothetical protein [Clostridiales bacterium]